MNRKDLSPYYIIDADVLRRIHETLNLALILSDDEYEDIFKCLVRYYFTDYTIIRNDLTLGFVRYLLIPTSVPIIINWNIGSKVAEQVCENDIKNRKINTFKCLVDGSISLSWNKNNVIIP